MRTFYRLINLTLFFFQPSTSISPHHEESINELCVDHFSAFPMTSTDAGLLLMASRWRCRVCMCVCVWVCVCAIIILRTGWRQLFKTRQMYAYQCISSPIHYSRIRECLLQYYFTNFTACTFLVCKLCQRNDGATAKGSSILLAESLWFPLANWEEYHDGDIN